MTTPEVPKILYGSVYHPEDVVRETLASLIEAAGGDEEFRKILGYYDALPGRALDIALHHSRLESILSLIGEVLVILSLHAGIVGCVMRFEGISFYPWVEAFLPALLILSVHVVLQLYWTTTWFNENLRPAFGTRDKDDAVRAGIGYYNSLALKLVTPVLFFYPIAASLSLLWIQAPIWAWCLEIPAAVFTGWMAMNLYYMRLLHTDIPELFSVFALGLDEQDASALRDARKGGGLHRKLWDWLETRGGANVSHFEIFTLAQCASGLVDAALVLLELFLLDDSAARLAVAIPIGLGLFVVGYAHFRRYAFLNRPNRMETSLVGQSALSHDVTESDPNERPAQDLDNKSRLLRRAMP